MQAVKNRKPRTRRVRKTLLTESTASITYDARQNRLASVIFSDIESPRSIESDVLSELSQPRQKHTSAVKDYTLQDPSFLDQFEEEVVASDSDFRDKDEIRVSKILETAQTTKSKKISVHGSSVHDTFTGEEGFWSEEDTVSGVSEESFSVYTDSSFIETKKNRNNEKRPKGDCYKEFPKTAYSMAYVKDSNVLPVLVRGMAEAAFLQVSDPVVYVSGYLLHSAKSPDELQLEPNPRSIEEVYRKYDSKHNRKLDKVPTEGRAWEAPLLCSSRYLNNLNSNFETSVQGPLKDSGRRFSHTSRNRNSLVLGRANANAKGR